MSTMICIALSILAIALCISAIHSKNYYSKLSSFVVRKNEETQKLNKEIAEKNANLHKEYSELNNNLVELRHNLSSVQDDLQREELSLKELSSSKEEYENCINSLIKTHAALVEAAGSTEDSKSVDISKFMINFTGQEKNDMQILLSIENKLHNPRPLYMLIWQTYYQSKVKTLFTEILGTKGVCGIYKITNQLNGKIYIGQSVNIKDRWVQHVKCGLGIDTPQGVKLYQAMKKDGIENFSFEIAEKCPKADLNEKESLWIDFYNSKEFGYNTQSGIKK